MHVHAVEQAALHGEVTRGEGDHRRDTRRVEVAAASEVILAGGQTGEQPRQHLVERRPRVGHHPAERALDVRGRLVELCRRPSVQPQVEARREDALVAALERVPQPLDVLVGDLALDARDAAALRVEQPRGLQLDHALSEAAHRLLRVERLEVQAQVQRRVEVDEPAEPVRADVARVVGEREHARELPIDGELRAALFDRGGCDEVGGGALAEGEAPRVGRRSAARLRTSEQ